MDFHFSLYCLTNSIQSCHAIPYGLEHKLGIHGIRFMVCPIHTKGAGPHHPNFLGPRTNVIYDLTQRNQIWHSNPARGGRVYKGQPCPNLQTVPQDSQIWGRLHFTHTVDLICHGNPHFVGTMQPYCLIQGSGLQHSQNFGTSYLCTYNLT